MTAKQATAMKAALEALDQIEQWKLPETGCKWDDGTPMSYGAAHGSNGEREYIRSVSRAALKLLRECGEEWEPIGSYKGPHIRVLAGKRANGEWTASVMLPSDFVYYKMTHWQTLPLPPQEAK